MVNAEKYRDLIIEIFKATRINGYKISCDLLREIEIALLIYEPHDFS